LIKVIDELNTPFKFGKEPTWKPKLDRINIITTELLGKSLDFGTGTMLTPPPTPPTLLPPPTPPPTPTPPTSTNPYQPIPY
jgi:hypothetical protein